MTPITKYILRNLASNPFITVLVLTSMVVVGATVGGVGGVLAGLRRAFSSSGHDNRVVVSLRDSTSEAHSELPLESLGRITTQSAVSQFSPEIVIESLVARPAGGADPITLRALEPQGFEIHGLQILEGRMPNKGAPEIIIGENMRRHLPWLGVGATLDMANEKFTCVGIFRSSGFLSGEAWTTRAALLSDPRRIALSVVYLDTPSKADAAALVEKLRADRTIRVDAAPESEYYSKLRGEHDHLIRAMMIVFFLVVCGAILVASSLLSLVERRRAAEFITLRAIGFRARVIATIVIWETELLAIGGGALGLLAAVIALQDYTVHSASPTPGGGSITFSASLSWPIGCIALAIMFLVGLVGALAPIVRLQWTEIASGLREE